MGDVEKLIDSTARKMAQEAKDLAKDAQAQVRGHKDGCEIKMEALKDKIDTEFEHNREGHIELKASMDAGFAHSTEQRDVTLKLIEEADKRMMRYWVRGGGAVIILLAGVLLKEFLK